MTTSPSFSTREVKDRVLLKPETRILVDKLLKATNSTKDVSGMTLVEKMSVAMRAAAGTIDALKLRISDLQEKDAGRNKMSIYREYARAKMHKDGKIEFDENLLVSYGFDAGAYVEGWSWIEEEDVINYLFDEVLDNRNRNPVLADVVRKIVATTEDVELVSRGNGILEGLADGGDINIAIAKEFVALAGVEGFYALAIESMRENTVDADRPLG